jgi:hypothetical protein
VVIEKRVVTIGLLDQSPVHPSEVFADVIADRAAAVIFAQNHRSLYIRNRFGARNTRKSTRFDSLRSLGS